MRMTRQHFQALADACAEIIIRTNADRVQSKTIIEEISSVCARSNPGFNSERFDAWIQDILIKNSWFSLTSPSRTCKILKMKYFLNSLSLFCARRFFSAYHSSWSSRRSAFWLNRYIGIRQMLPKMTDGNHWGNHRWSLAKPYRATQGGCNWK